MAGLATDWRTRIQERLIKKPSQATSTEVRRQKVDETIGGFSDRDVIARKPTVGTSAKRQVRDYLLCIRGLQFSQSRIDDSCPI